MDSDEIIPRWEKPDNVPQPGTTHIWVLKITKVTSHDEYSQKPYLKMTVEVMDGPFLGHSFEFRLYYSQKSEKRCKWFLKKFGYPAELLDSDTPRLKKSLMVNLSGKARVEISTYQGSDGNEYLDYDLKAFERLAETELEEKLEKEKSSPTDQSGSLGFPSEQPTPRSPVPEVDLNADIKESDEEEKKRAAAEAAAALDGAYIDGIDEPMDIGI